MAHNFKPGDRVWINLVDMGPPDIRKATVLASSYESLEGIRLDMVRVMVDGANFDAWWYPFRISHFGPLDLLAEVS